MMLALRVVQAVCFMALLGLGWLSGHRVAEGHERPIEFSLAVLGERELPDGSWRGVDVLAEPHAPIDRLQLQVRSGSTATLQVDVLEAVGEHRVYPVDAEQAALSRRVTTVLPSATAFYRVTGPSTLRVRVRRAGEVGLQPAQPTGRQASTEGVLSDGAPFATTQRVYRASGGGELQLQVGGEVPGRPW